MSQPGIVAVGTALPPHRADQEELIEAFRRIWAGTHHHLDRIEQLHRAVRVRSRYLALPVEAYERIAGFADANRHWIACALALGAEATSRALQAAGIEPRDVDHFLFTTVTGIATPSIDARLIDRLGLRSDLRRLPLFGLGCVGGAAGIARAADLLRGGGEIAVLLSVELCSLTLQRGDRSVANLIASGLFGDGAAAVVLAGPARRPASPRVVATRSIFYPATERIMGWDVEDTGFRVVLSAEVPSLARERLGGDVDRFLADHGLRRADVARWICHPGGPRVIEALEQALKLPPDALAITKRSLEEVGNLSSASVLFVLADHLADAPPPGAHGVLLAMGPGFCSELVLLQW